MTPLTFITDETHKRPYVQIDLAKVAEIDDEQSEDIMDIIIAEARKDDVQRTGKSIKS